jgi:ABC-type spermidine/putrescine transport system permease subunit II
MEWYWIGIIVGLLAPWFVMGRAILIGFQERGLQGGLGIWLGVSLLTVPLVLVIMWLAGPVLR